MGTGAEVKTSFPDRFTGPGGRNRIRGGASDSGSTHDLGPGSTSNKRANNDALKGTYGAKEIGDVARVILQENVKGTGGGGGKAPFDSTMTTEREKQTMAGKDRNSHHPASEKQGPDGNFGDKPGDGSRSDTWVIRP